MADTPPIKLEVVVANLEITNAMPGRAGGTIYDVTAMVRIAGPRFAELFLTVPAFSTKSLDNATLVALRDVGAWAQWVADTVKARLA